MARSRGHRRRPPRRLQVRGRLGGAPAAHLRAERARHRGAARRDAGGGRRPHRLLVERRRLRHARTSTSSPRTPRRPRRRPTASRSSSASGCCATRRVADRAPAHLAALLQRRRLGATGSLRHEPAQPVPARLRGARRGSHAPHQRRRLPDARRHERARLHPRRRPRGCARRRGAAARRRRDRVEPVYNLGSGDGVSVRADHGRHGRASPASTFTPEIAPRRAGDPARIVASGELAARDLDWTMRHSLDDMVRDAWKARTASA